METDKWFQKDHSEEEVFDQAKLFEARGENEKAKRLLRAFFVKKNKPYRAAFIEEQFEKGASVGVIEAGVLRQARRVEARVERRELGAPQRVAQEHRQADLGPPRRVPVNRKVVHRVPQEAEDFPNH